MIKLTASATSEVQKIMKDQELETDKNFLRIGVKGGGCSGYQFSLDITTEKTDEAELWNHDGVQVICDSRSHIYLDGTTVDYQDGLMGKGFLFDCPSSKTQCGCRKSFSL